MDCIVSVSPSSSLSLDKTTILFLTVLRVVIEVSFTVTGTSFWSVTLMVIAFDELAGVDPLSVATTLIE